MSNGPLDKSCHLCQSKSLRELLDVGPQPVSNRFITNLAEEDSEYPMRLNLCRVCGTIQINDPVSAAELTPRFDWITYNEPEDHLDRMVAEITRLPGLTKDARIAGVTFKDDTTLTRLNKLGYPNTWRIDPKEHLGIDNPGAGAEMVQAALTVESVEQWPEKCGSFDVVIVRHILEHAHDVHEFMNAVKRLLKPNGYVVYEVPDCSKALDHCDYTTLWEEHTLYFTPDTFKSCFGLNGLSLVYYDCHPYPFENSLIGIGQPSADAKQVFPEHDVLEQEVARAVNFAQGLGLQRKAVQSFLKDFVKNKGKVALFGAGHLAATFLSVLDIVDYVSFVVDDHPNKKGLYMPGSRLPIVGSSELIEQDIKLCLLSLNPLSQEKVVANNQAYIDQGGEFASIFPSSKRALSAIAAKREGPHAVQSL